MRIKSVKPYRNDVSRVVVYFEDKSYLTVDAMEARRLSLAPGMELDETVLPELGEESRRHAARVKAVQISGKRAFSTAELTRKLCEKGICESDASDAVRWLMDLGALDDTAYAEMLLRHYRAKGFGAMRIREEMRRRGLEKELIQSVLEEDQTDSRDAVVGFLQQKLRGRSPDEAEKRKLFAALQRRGFSYEEIKNGFYAIERGDLD